jgi:hypothetical protein
MVLITRNENCRGSQHSAEEGLSSFWMLFEHPVFRVRQIKQGATGIPVHRAFRRRTFMAKLAGIRFHKSHSLSVAGTDWVVLGHEGIVSGSGFPVLT